MLILSVLLVGMSTRKQLESVYRNGLLLRTSDCIHPVCTASQCLKCANCCCVASMHLTPGLLTSHCLILLDCFICFEVPCCYSLQCRLDKERENAVALQVLPDLLTELDVLSPRERLLALVQGILAANIFDWGARACVALYTNGTILDIYRDARRKLSRRPWRVDQFDAFCERVYGPTTADHADAAGELRRHWPAPGVLCSQGV